MPRSHSEWRQTSIYVVEIVVDGKVYHVETVKSFSTEDAINYVLMDIIGRRLEDTMQKMDRLLAIAQKVNGHNKEGSTGP